MIPKKFNHFHQISILFQIFAFKTDGELSDTERETLFLLLNQWIDDPDETKNIYVESANFLSEYNNKHPEKMLDLFTESANKIYESGIFTEAHLKAIILDIKTIGESDNKLIEMEKNVIMYLSEIWQIKW